MINRKELIIMTDTNHLALWVEKYRPTTLDTYLANDVLRAQIKSWIETGNIPHLLLHGPPGTGKTTMAQIVLNHVDDHLVINASADNNMDTIRNKLNAFAASLGFGGGLKVVLLDEFDYMQSGAQAARRGRRLHCAI
jgi:replication factor C small subunit